MSEECIFCRPDPTLTISHHGRAFAMVCPDPIKPGHIAVAVQSHKAFLQDIDSVEAEDLFSLSNRMAKGLVAEYKAEKVYVAALGEQSVHFHVHLFPRLPTDPRLGPYVFGDAGWASKAGRPFPLEEQLALAKKLRARK